MRSILPLLILLISQQLVAQNHCGRDHILKDPDWSEKSSLQESILQSAIEAGMLRGGPITVPVVFHQIALSEENFLPDQKFEEQIQILNEDYGNFSPNNDGTPFELESLPVDMGIRFCLAQTDPSGAPTSGIEKILGVDDCIGDIGVVKDPFENKPRLYYTDLGGADAWDPEKYLNIWVADVCGTFLGYSSFPEEGLPEEDGVIIDTPYFGNNEADGEAYPYHLGRIATHEVGHYFNLLHTWGEGGCDSDDKVNDTPVQETFHLGCPSHPSISCGSADYFFNFMDYTD
ncbi:MAG: hypothetical protein HKN16_03355, partial [Saprospiraceae bacterium]|nr:hypothetical protein [Saprospiraceae bacterium]